jgi:D-alanine--poly(phosphoribitol) ligase subunit 1
MSEGSRTYRFTAGQEFEAVASAHPSRLALRLPDRSVTYAELDAASNRVARQLRKRGVGQRDVIAIAHTKTVECYAAMLASLKLGSIYCNIDETNPTERLARIFSTCQPRLVVGVGVGVGEGLSDGVRGAASSSGAGLLDFAEQDVRNEHLDTSPTPLATDGLTGADPAYIMYTSGSTGTPKGATMTHANVLNFAAWARQRFAITPDDVLTNVNPMYFDNSVFDFYASLLNGAAMAPVPRAFTADAPRLVQAVDKAGCTIWFSVPSMLIYLMSMKVLNADSFARIRSIVFGGEGYPKPELRRLHRLFGSRASLVNVYGPTECTCICSARAIEPEDLADDAGFAPLGPVADNFGFIVFDEDEQAVGAGGVGELWLSGPQVGLGYYNDPDRTSASFPSNPLNLAWSERCYRTGDIVRVGADGRCLSFVGRHDNQIKHMGYRIELEEIEAALQRVPGVVQAAVVYKAGSRGFKHIVAYVSGDSLPDEDGLRQSLRNTLPSYMVPQRFNLMEELPRNANGKIDRRSLTEIVD